MRINGIKISEYNAELIDRIASTQNIETVTDWLDGSVQGTLLRQDYEYRSLRLTFVVKSQNENEAYKNISRLTEALKKCIIRFDDIQLIFPCLLSGNSIPERLQNGVFKVVYVLKNDWGIGDEINVDFPITSPNAQQIKVKYIENWITTAKGYSVCYDENELYKTIAEETVYIDNDAVAVAASQSHTWSQFFLTLGVDLDKYRPVNCLNGFVNLAEEYTEAGAMTLFSRTAAFDIYYNRFQKVSYADVPESTTYPSLVWTVGANSDKYYVDLGVGTGWQVKDITVYVWGRWYAINTTSEKNGAMFGSKDDYSFALTLDGANTKYYLGSTLQEGVAKVFQSTTSSGHNVIIETLEDIDKVPFRKYGIKSSLDNAAPIGGFADIIFNGVTIDRMGIYNSTLTSNLAIMRSGEKYAKACEITRVQVYHQGELIRDLIPVGGNIKNGFVNTYDSGMYDINTMEFIPWTKGNGTQGSHPDNLMVIPSVPDTPQPPAFVTVLNGSGTGSYDSGCYVSIVAEEAPTGYTFNGWQVNSGTVSIINPDNTDTGFIMGDGDVVVEATYISI